MKILQINQNYNFGSTGKIMKEIGDSICASGNESYMLCAYAKGTTDRLFVMEKLPTYLAVRKNILIQSVTGLSGFTSWFQTKKAISWIKEVNPDVIHMHNIHGDWINIGILLECLHDLRKPVVWTLHDCWAFTGRCSHFENFGCFKWKTGCHDCGDRIVYPKSYFLDFSKYMWGKKKNWFTKLNNVHIVTPSEWLAGYVRESYLGKYNISVINNGIDLKNFSRRANKSSYLQDSDKKIVLGVASSWTPQKGLDDFKQLLSKLDKEKYQIVLVGLNKRQLESIPAGILGISRTTNIDELSELYSNAAVFVNPTYQDNYPTVNLESIACGTPVITYNTGGSVESVTETTGRIVEKGNVESLAKGIIELCESGHDFSGDCVAYAQKHFSKNDRYKEYIELYENIMRK